MKNNLLLFFCIIIIISTTACGADDSFTEKDYNNIKFSIPGDWEDTSSKDVAMYANKKEGADITLSIASTPSSDMTLQDYTKIATRSYSSGFITSSNSNEKKDLSNVSIDEPEYLMINDNQLSKTLITYEHKTEKDTFKFNEIVVCGIIDNTIYQFNYKVHSDEYDSYKDKIDKSIESIAKK